jgi:hypothetical protein
VGTQARVAAKSGGRRPGRWVGCLVRWVGCIRPGQSWRRRSHSRSPTSPSPSSCASGSAPPPRRSWRTRWRRSWSTSRPCCSRRPSGPARGASAASAFSAVNPYCAAVLYGCTAGGLHGRNRRASAPGQWPQRFHEIEWPVLLLLSWAVKWGEERGERTPSAPRRVKSAERQVSQAVIRGACPRPTAGGVGSLWPEAELPAAQHRVDIGTVGPGLAPA